MPRLEIQLLGSFHVALDKAPVTIFESNKVRALLAYLVVESEQAHSRSKLAALLWPDKPEKTALSNLRYALTNLRSAVADRATQPPHLIVSRREIQFNVSEHNWCDVHAFESFLKASEGAGENRTISQAISLYQGCFLDGFLLPDSNPFEEWVSVQRERLQQLALKALKRLADYYEIAGKFSQSEIYVRKQLALAPWLEEAHRQLMRLLVYSDRRSLAITQYELCKTILERELDVEPTEETIQLFEQIRSGTLITPPTPPRFLWDVQPVLEKRPLFVARQSELTRLEAALLRAFRGEGNVQFIIGDAGRGKTALLKEFSRIAQLNHSELVVVMGKAQAYFGTGDPYLPFREVLEILTCDIEARWVAGTISQEHAMRLWQCLPIVVQAIVENGPSLIETLVPGLPMLSKVSQATLTTPKWLIRLKELIEYHRRAPSGPQPQQDDLFNQYGKVLRVISRHNPLLVILDDLQWADRGTYDLLFHLGRQLSGARILIVGAFRSEDITPELRGPRHPLVDLANEFRILFGDVSINLDESLGRDFVDAYLDSESNCLGDSFRLKLHQQTLGHPLFTIELLRRMQDRGDLYLDQNGEWAESPSISWEDLPPKVEAAIGERLSNLPAKYWEMLQIACIEGERFTAQAVARVLDVEEHLIIESLSGELVRKYKLVRADSTGQIGGRPLSRYQFQHVLLQIYFYKSLDKVMRSHLHLQIAEALEQLYKDHSSEIALQLAHHFQQAQIYHKAVDYLMLAGNNAIRLSANEEAVFHFSKGLELLDSLPQTSDRQMKELRLLISMSSALMWTRGYASPELGKICERARDLMQKSEYNPELRSMIWHLWSYYAMRAENSAALSLLRQLSKFAEHTDDPLRFLLPNWGSGFSLGRTGELEPALFHLEAVLNLPGLTKHNELVYIYGTDPLVACLTWSSWALWMLGHPVTAKQRSQAAIERSHSVSHAGSLTFAYGTSALLHLFIKEWSAALEWNASCAALAAEQKLPFFQAISIFMQGWALVELGQIEEGLAEMEKGLQAFEMTGTRDLLSMLICQMARAYALAGQLEAAAGKLEEGEAFIQETGERIYEPELWRTKGEVFLRQSPVKVDEAEQFFRFAKQVAIQQKAKSWELRASLSLGHLLKKTGRQLEARKQLVEVYGWFSEGFETPDLKEAKSLLEDLNSDA